MGLNRNIRNFLAVSAFALMGAAYAGEPSPDAEVKSATDEVLAIMAQTSDVRALLNLAETKVVPHFDFRRMAQLAAGRVWGQANAEQQDRIAAAFQHLLVRTYTQAIASSRQAKTAVVVRPTQVDAGSTEATVRTTINEPGRRPIAVNYRMERGPSGWKVVDVVVENISLVTNYREWFSGQYQNGGIDAVIRALDGKNRAAAEAAT